MNYTKENIHITDVRVGDTVEHNGKFMTVCSNDIETRGFMGTTLFGDSYKCGYQPVVRINIIRAMPNKALII